MANLPNKVEIDNEEMNDGNKKNLIMKIGISNFYSRILAIYWDIFAIWRSGTIGGNSIFL